MHAENLFQLSAYSQTFYTHSHHVGHISCRRRVARTCPTKLCSSTRHVSAMRGWVVMCTQNLRTRTGYIFSSP